MSTYTRKVCPVCGSDDVQVYVSAWVDANQWFSDETPTNPEWDGEGGTRNTFCNACQNEVGALQDKEVCTVTVNCPDCGGHGADRASDNLNWLPCRTCSGKGRVTA